MKLSRRTYTIFFLILATGLCLRGGKPSSFYRPFGDVYDPPPLPDPFPDDPPSPFDNPFDPINDLPDPFEDLPPLPDLPPPGESAARLAVPRAASGATNVPTALMPFPMRL